MMMARDSHPIVLFDGLCNLCSRAVAFIIRHDPEAQFRMAPLQSEAGRNLLSQHGLDPDAVNTIVLITGGRAFAKSEAAVGIARRLHGWPRLSWWTHVVPVPLRDAVYDWVSRNRFRWFGRRGQCMVPGPDVSDRFLQASDEAGTGAAAARGATLKS